MSEDKTEDVEATSTDTDENTDTATGDDALGDAGQKALQAERAKARAEARARKKAETELATLKAKMDKGASTDEPLDAKAIAEAAKAEARAELLKDRAADKIEVLAAKSFANPAMAARLLASQVNEFIAGGSVDTDAIKDALSDLLEAEPYLAAKPAKRFEGTADQGHRGGRSPNFDQLLQDAHKRGDLMEIIRLENSKLAPIVQRMQGLQPS